eukprot:967127-Prymnesium_polylepis.2
MASPRTLPLHSSCVSHIGRWGWMRKAAQRSHAAAGTPTECVRSRSSGRSRKMPAPCRLESLLSVERARTLRLGMRSSICLHVCRW